MTTYISNRNTKSYINEEGHYRFHTKLFSGTIVDGCSVVATDPMSMAVEIETGDLLINFQNEFSYTAWIALPMTLSIDNTTTGMMRVDRVIAYVNRSITYPATPVTSNNPNALQIIVVKGTEIASNPVKATDAVVQTAVNQIGKRADGLNNPWVELATVEILSGVTMITTGQITNTANEIVATNLVDQVYPVGSVYMSANNSNNPATYLGVGTWQAFAQGQVMVNQLISDSDFKTLGATGGSKTVTLTYDQLASHNHTGWTSTDGSHQHSFTGAQGSNNVQMGNTYDREHWGGYWHRGDRWESSDDGLCIRWTDWAGNHTHTFSTNSVGGGQAHNNLEPYITVYCWLRIADKDSPLPEQPEPIVVVTQPASTINQKDGSTLTLSVEVTGSSPVRYQWYVDNSPISDATSATIALESVQEANSGVYTCQVWNDINEAYTDPCTVSITAPVAPSITTQPDDQFVDNGATATFTVVADGDTPLAYQWFNNGTAISGATDETYSTSDGTSGDTYQITVTVTNSVGSATSDIATYGVDIVDKETES